MALHAGRMPEIIVEEMREEHLPGVLEIENRSFPTPWSRKAFLSELRDNAFAHYIVLLDGDRVVGYGGMWLLFDEAHVTNIAIHPAYRGRGLGGFLLTEMERRAAARGMKRMTLEVRPSNVMAQRLYRKHGFQPRGLRRGYYADTREDAIIMWKDDLQAGNP